MPGHGGPKQVVQETERMGEKRGQEPFFHGFPKMQWAGQGKWAYLAGLNHCSGLWDLRSVSNCLVPGPVVIRAEEQWRIFCKNSGRRWLRVGLWIGRFA